MSASFCVAAAALLFSTQASAQSTMLDTQLRRALARNGFTGTMQSQLTESTANYLGRPIDLPLVGLGSFLWFDPILSLHNDTTCASCHSPANDWGDSQPIALGVQSNYPVGVQFIDEYGVLQGRIGPRNLRRSPMTANVAFYPAQMWDGRFSVPYPGNPFDNLNGFDFPEPEGLAVAFPGGTDDPVTHLLAAQAFLPVTELVEMAGFTGLASSSDEFADLYDDFDDGLGDALPAADASGYRHDPIRDALLTRLNDSAEYVRRFTRLFPSAAGGNIEFWMVGAALAEFQFNQVAADAPLDKYARGEGTLTTAQKRGALVFFGKGQCVSCHQVAGSSNEMFSDFQNHRIGVPQVAPVFGAGTGNAVFDGASVAGGTDGMEDYGLERTTGSDTDRYKFRTAPLRNLARSPAYMHNGAFTDLELAIRHHLDVAGSLDSYDDSVLPDDLTRGPDPDLVNYPLDDALDQDLGLTEADIANLVVFVRDALLDPKTTATRQCDAAPDTVLPSGLDYEYFPGCTTQPGHVPPGR